MGEIPKEKTSHDSGSATGGKDLDFGGLCSASLRNLAYYNLDEDPACREFFSITRNPDELLRLLSAARGRPILPERTLLVFDEIQASPEALGSLKYFCEHASRYHVAAAGSLLGVMLVAQPGAFPVGKVHIEYLHSMSFTEFLLAGGDESLAEYLHSVPVTGTVPEAIERRLDEQLQLYLIIGGMPEAVRSWSESRDMNIADPQLWQMINQQLGDILQMYRGDFPRHPDRAVTPRIAALWQTIPSQLGQNNRKFRYAAVAPSARAREYETAVQWLSDAGLVYKVSRASAARLPLSAYDDPASFKLYMHDVGLLRRMAGIQPTRALADNQLYVEFKGAVTENYILQSLVPQLEIAPHYWVERPYEADFLVQIENEILPVEVKSGRSVRSTSLQKYAKQHSPALKIRFSRQNLQLRDGLLNIPLYLADETHRLVSEALNLRRQSNLQNNASFSNRFFGF